MFTKRTSIVECSFHKFQAVHPHRVTVRTKSPLSQSPGRPHLDSGTNGLSSDPHPAKPRNCGHLSRHRQIFKYSETGERLGMTFLRLIFF